MIHYLMMCRPLTYAQRTARVLEKAGIAAIVTKAPQELTTDGCGYCVKVSEKRLADALINLNKANLPPVKVFVSGTKDRYSEVQL